MSLQQFSAQNTEGFTPFEETSTACHVPLEYINKLLFVPDDSSAVRYKQILTTKQYRSLVNHPVTEDEMNRQARFGAICKATILRLADPTKKTQDQMAFKEQTDDKTLRQYVWHQCAEEYDNNNA